MKGKISKIEKEAMKFRKELWNRIITLIISAFGFVAALAWNDAIKSSVETFIKAEDVWYYKIINAIVVTIISVAVIYSLTKFSKTTS